MTARTCLHPPDARLFTPPLAWTGGADPVRIVSCAVCGETLGLFRPLRPQPGEQATRHDPGPRPSVGVHAPKVQRAPADRSSARRPNRNHHRTGGRG